MLSLHSQSVSLVLSLPSILSTLVVLPVLVLSPVVFHALRSFLKPAILRVRHISQQSLVLSKLGKKVTIISFRLPQKLVRVRNSSSMAAKLRLRMAPMLRLVQ